MQFGVKTEFARTPLPESLALEELTATPKFVLAVAGAGSNTWRFPYNGALSAMVVNRLLKGGAKVSLTKSEAGASYVLTMAKPEVWAKATSGFEVRPDSTASGKSPALATTLNAPRIGVYQSFDPSMDEGWTRWVLDHYQFDYTVLHNKDVKAGNLRRKFDVILLPDQRANAILDGLDYKTIVKTIVEEYRGGIGETGWESLQRFVSEGGTLVALGEATNLLVEKLPLGVKDLKRTFTRDQHFAPGTIVNLQIDPNHPLGRGMAPETYGFYINSPFFQLTEGFSSQR